MKREQIQADLKHIMNCLITFLKWIVISIVCGLGIGLVGIAFSYSMAFVTDFRTTHPIIILGLPIGGLFIVFLYKIFKNENDTGTNLVLSSIQSKDEVPLRMAPCIFLSTIITHLFGGSAGREGAALQLGGSIGSSIGKFFHMNDSDRHIITMCGMSAAFSALFGTPMTAAIFPMEVVSIGIMQYTAIVPCVIASFGAHQLASFCGLHAEAFPFTEIPAFSWKSGIFIGALAIGCAFVSVLLCIALHHASHRYKYFFKNPYIRIAVGGLIVICLTFLSGNQAYNGAGMNYIESFFEESAVFPAAFLLKILFTACTLGAGFKGGEIVPTLYVGAAFGCFFGMISGFASNLCTAVGMIGVFCGVTNCPVSSLLLSFELFGYDGMPYYLLAVAISYMLSGRFGLYTSQKLMSAKINLQP